MVTWSIQAQQTSTSSPLKLDFISDEESQKSSINEAAFNGLFQRRPDSRTRIYPRSYNIEDLCLQILYPYRTLYRFPYGFYADVSGQLKKAVTGNNENNFRDALVNNRRQPF